MVNEIDLSRADLNLLLLFEVMMRERHAGRAAEQLNLSASAVSHGLGRLRLLLNDPLFVKHPKGMHPTARAEALSEAIDDILARARVLIASAEPFDPRRSIRRFTLGAPDAISTTIVPPLLGQLERVAPGIGLSVLSVMPQTVQADLDAQRIDIALQPVAEMPKRFVLAPLYEEEFVIAMCAGHRLRGSVTLDDYCRASHLLVSLSGDPSGNVDAELQKIGRSRRVVATVSHFLFALAMVSQTDLLAAVPRRLATRYAKALGVVLAEPPAPLAPLGRGPVSAIVTGASLADAGLAWLFRIIGDVSKDTTLRRTEPGRRSARRLVGR
jgi:DNA-binding transcriptional LysR family regulator